jgi:hypothetical protein
VKGIRDRRRGTGSKLAHYGWFVYEKGGLLAEEGDRMAGLPVSGVDREIWGRNALFRNESN